TETFAWNDSGASQYWLWVGTTEGGHEIYSDSQGTNTSRSVSGLPQNGETIYVRLYSVVDGEWLFNDYTYTAFNADSMKAEIQSPVPGSTLSSIKETFTWNSTSAEEYWLWVGTTQGGHEIYSDGQETNTSREVSNLPGDGTTVYVRLHSMVNGEWLFNDYTYTACNTDSMKGVIQSPVPGSTLSSMTETFTWSNPGVEKFWLWVGTTQGGHEIYSDGQETNTSREISNLPSDGTTVYVRLHSMVDGQWLFNDYTYTACNADSKKGVMQSPVPGSTLSSTTETFTWNNPGVE
ncbi:MAG: hypothetical protein GY754_27075, partial [bacterium]|nr:hypothetical protein [bacterium]